MNKTRKKYLINLTVLLSVVFVITQTTSFHIGKDNSLPQSYFISIKFMMPKCGDLAVIEGHSTKYFNDIGYIKRVVGIEGDTIQVQGKIIKINDQYLGKLLSKTKFNQFLNPISLKNKIIPKGYVFVAGDHERSFDSRYKEFGLVKLEHIKGRAYGF